jgi:pyruvate kinase
MVDSSKPIS